METTFLELDQKPAILHELQTSPVSVPGASKLEALREKRIEKIVKTAAKTGKQKRSQNAVEVARVISKNFSWAELLPASELRARIDSDRAG